MFSGYCLEETNGWFLQNKHMVYLKKSNTKKSKAIQINLPIHKFHLSAHAGRSELLDFIKKTNPGKIVCVHGDHCPEFAEELKGMGFDATAPKNGDLLEL